MNYSDCNIGKWHPRGNPESKFYVVSMAIISAILLFSFPFVSLFYSVKLVEAKTNGEVSWESYIAQSGDYQLNHARVIDDNSTNAR